MRVEMQMETTVVTTQRATRAEYAFGLPSSIMGIAQRKSDRFASRTDRQALLGGLVDVFGRKVSHSSLSIRPKPQFGRTMFHE